jgi:hypothetical protein
MKIKELLHELKHHAPFTAFATAIAIVLVIIFQYYLQADISENIFEILHPLHIVASAMVTAGIFYKYRPKVLPALLVGLVSSIIIGSLSDILIPWAGGNLFNLQTSFHLPVLEQPVFILSSAIVGGLAGITTKITRMPHFVHVFLSVFASLFYLLAFSAGFNLLYFAAAFALVFIAVIIPCCVDDILFPFLFLGEKIKHCDC